MAQMRVQSGAAKPCIFKTRAADLADCLPTV